MNRQVDICHIVARVRTDEGDYEVDLFMGNGGCARAIVDRPDGEQYGRDVWINCQARDGIKKAAVSACALTPRRLPVLGEVD